jgi:hypothetical protein
VSELVSPTRQRGEGSARDQPPRLRVGLTCGGVTGELATDAIAELEGAVEELNAVLVLLENGKVE